MSTQNTITFGTYKEVPYTFRDEASEVTFTLKLNYWVPSPGAQDDDDVYILGVSRVECGSDCHTSGLDFAVAARVAIASLLGARLRSDTALRRQLASACREYLAAPSPQP